MGNPVLVNGANGWLGSSLMRVADTQPLVAGVREDRARFAQSILIDSNGTSPDGALTKIGTIINCAGRVTGTVAEVEHANVAHAIQLASDAKAAGVRRFVQVSSFSVYGDAENIRPTTPLKPINNYGHSKLAAEQALLSLSTSEFQVTCVRLPFMFSRSKPALMGHLIKALNQLPFWPTMPASIRRSMITYDGAAKLLLQAALDEPTDIIAVSDPRLFTIELLVSAMQRHQCATARLVSTPLWITGPIRRFIPSLGRRLFQSNVLEPACNWAMGREFGEGIEHEIEATIAQIVSAPSS